MSNDDHESGISEEHRKTLIDDDLPVDPEQVDQADVEDFPTE